LFLFAPLFQLVEEVAMLVAAVIVLIDDLPQVQVGGMQYLHFFDNNYVSIRYV
jgi:hypothetical protein